MERERMGREGEEGREKKRRERRLVTWNVNQGMMRWGWLCSVLARQSQDHSPNSAERERSVHLKRLGW